MNTGFGSCEFFNMHHRLHQTKCRRVHGGAYCIQIIEIYTNKNDEMKNDAESKFINDWSQILFNDKFAGIISNLINMTNDELMPEMEIFIQKII